MMLDELNIPIKQLYVSEIDKFANQAADLLYDKNIHLGCITTLRRATCWKMSTLIKAFNSNYLSDSVKESLAAAMELRGKFVDVLSSGFPCQAWSLAGKQKGDSDPRGALVHDMLKLWAYMANINPDIKFFFENVSMKKEFMTYINDLFKCEPTKINSALLTAQNRDRNYWANWNISQPEDKGVILADILEYEVDEKYLLSERLVKGFKAKMKRRSEAGTGFDKMNIVNSNEKCSTLTARYFKCSSTDPYVEVEIRPCEMREIKGGGLCHHVANATDIKSNESNKRIYDATGKSPTLTTMGGGHREPKVLVSEGRYRKLTPYECMMLQGWPMWVIEVLLNSGLSNTQLYKLCGNGWTHPVIVHDFKCLIDTGWMKANP
jgi:DNA (cytosine-5)-methyltransferase 1/DNA (cytosine-5)-methyltransferase 3A